MVHADLMCWRGLSLYSCPTDFRLYWARAKLAEDGGGADGPPSPRHPRRFLPLPTYPATRGGLRAAHSTPVAFTRDGVYLLHRQAHYTPGQTPLALTWKDAACSRYLVDTDRVGAPLAQQQVWGGEAGESGPGWLLPLQPLPGGRRPGWRLRCSSSSRRVVAHCFMSSLPIVGGGAPGGGGD